MIHHHGYGVKAQMHGVIPQKKRLAEYAPKKEHGKARAEAGFFHDTEKVLQG